MLRKEEVLTSIRNLREKLSICDERFPIDMASSIYMTLTARGSKEITSDEYKNYIRDIDDIALEFSNTCKCMRTESSLIHR